MPPRLVGFLFIPKFAGEHLVLAYRSVSSAKYAIWSSTVAVNETESRNAAWVNITGKDAEQVSCTGALHLFFQLRKRPYGTDYDRI